MHFAYDERAVGYLARRDKRLGEVMERLGPLRREVMPDLFAALIHAIVGQQVSMTVQRTLWQRLCARLGEVTPSSVLAVAPEELRALGLSGRKVEYVREAAQAVTDGRLDVEALREMDDAAVCAALVGLRGVGVWTAEMLLLFSLQRQDVLSYDDLAIRRGLRMLYRHREIDRERFERYRRRFSPYGSVASLYLWAVAGGALPELRDPAEAVQGGKRGGVPRPAGDARKKARSA